jgi:hypothetical protein
MMPAMLSRGYGLRWASGLVLALCLAGMLEACGGGNGSTSGATATSSSAEHATPATPRCRAKDLRIRFGNGGIGLGNDLTAFGVRNASGHPCTLAGFPRVILLDTSGKAVAVRAKPKGADYFGTTPKRIVTLTPTGLASFRLWSSANLNTTPCATVRAIRVIPPGDDSTREVRINIGHVCTGGITVSRFEPGRAAYQ